MRKNTIYGLRCDTMKLRNNILLCTLIILVLAIVTSAECPPDCPPEALPADPSTFDPNNPELFDYMNGDYSTITDWSQVNWNQIPPVRIANVPADKLDYAQLNPVQRIEMTVEQISNNLHVIENLATDVKEDRAREAIKQNYQVTVVSLGSNSRIVNNVLHAEFGEQDSLDLDGKPAWKLEIGDDGRIRVLEPAEVIEQKISPQDSFTLVSETKFISQSGAVNTVQHLSFKNGQAYVKEGDTARIGDYEIPASSNSIDIYFDPTTKPTGNYVTISEKGLDIGTTKDGAVKVNPQPGNELFQMVKNKYERDAQGNLIPETKSILPDEDATLSIAVTGGDAVQVISRSAEGKIPLIHHADGAGTTTIESGRININLEKGEVRVKSEPLKQALDYGIFENDADVDAPLDRHTSASFELKSDSFDSTVRVSSSNRYKVIDSQGIARVSNSAGLRVSDSIEQNAIKTSDDLRVKYPSTQFSISQKASKEAQYTEITPNMAQFIDEWFEQNPAAKRFARHIFFETRARALSLEEPGFLAFGERMIDGGTAQRRSGATNIFTVADHELRHSFDNYIEKYEREDYSEEVIRKEGITAKYREVVRMSADILVQDPQLKRILLEMERHTGERYDLTPPSIYEIPNKFEIVAARRGGGFHLIHHYNKRVEELTGLETYSFRTYPEDPRERYPEIPAEFARLPDFEIQQEIRKGNPVFIRLTQINYDTSIISERKYRELMGSYCDTNPCDRCLEYELTCISRRLRFY